MFVAQSTKGSAFWNGFLLFVVVVLAVLFTFMLVKLVKDPKDETAQRFTLGAKKKKTA